MATSAQIKAIYAMGSRLGINRNSREDELHHLVCGITGKDSIKELTVSEAYSVQSELMSRMKSVGKTSGLQKSRSTYRPEK